MDRSHRRSSLLSIRLCWVQSKPKPWRPIGGLQKTWSCGGRLSAVADRRSRITQSETSSTESSNRLFRTSMTEKGTKVNAQETVAADEIDSKGQVTTNKGSWRTPAPPPLGRAANNAAPRANPIHHQQWTCTGSFATNHSRVTIKQQGRPITCKAELVRTRSAVRVMHQLDGAEASICRRSIP